MKVRPFFAFRATISEVGLVAGGLRRAADRLLWRRFRPVAGWISAISAFFGRAWSTPGSSGVAERVLLWDRGGGRESMTCQSADVRDSWSAARLAPQRGLIYARPGVTLALTFAAAGLLACQSRTIRV